MQQTCLSLIALISFKLASATSSVLEAEPYIFIQDDSFNFQLQVSMGNIAYRAASVADILSAAQVITPGDWTTYNMTFYELALRSVERAEKATDPVTAADNYFAAATYYRNADFYLHGNWSDPLIDWYWAQQTTCFNQAIATLPVPGVRVTIPADGFDTIGIFYAASNKSEKRPILLVGNGYDAAQEDTLHTVGFAALRRGWNVMTYEGPGQPTVRREQGLGFIYDWERVVTPAVDYLANRTDVDMSKLVLMGISMGGYLAARATAFEPRIKALIMDDGVYDVYAGDIADFSNASLALFNSGNQSAFDDLIDTYFSNNPNVSTQAYWGVTQGLWSFNTQSAFEWLEESKNFTLANITQRIQVPTWVGNALNDTNFPGQAVEAAKAIGPHATLHNFTGAASLHCQAGASEEANTVIFDWIDDVFSGVKVSDSSSN